MNPTTLQLPLREVKPRSAGITMMVDGGLPTRYFEDVEVVDRHAGLVE